MPRKNKVLRNQSSQNTSKKFTFVAEKELVGFSRWFRENIVWIFSLFFLSENAWFAAMCTFIEITTIGCQSPCTNTMSQNTKVHQQFDICRKGKNACIKRSGLLCPVDHLLHWLYSMFWCWPSKYPDFLEPPFSPNSQTLRKYSPSFCCIPLPSGHPANRIQPCFVTPDLLQSLLKSPMRSNSAFSPFLYVNLRKKKKQEGYP